eukprot:CAMPEP_0183315936 /NCGR_PEP_ID=MMETSP0160_2-20130417/53262_1 /TAXON_ID=2839 ORGANISM="Odontella Sinensis, Strain Grunow 1884" /NCGR_SAMPLE_ID=MMETSP0160_2 /ASSEMBLY_ACC=CAM_ASM_000250 /LENGTH=59 /DNA_ID=CAMNT_0025481613 /DNA_START=160 /DNA_END=335 /DNA_ORIENTATION=-
MSAADVLVVATTNWKTNGYSFGNDVTKGMGEEHEASRVDPPDRVDNCLRTDDGDMSPFL